MNLLRNEKSPYLLQHADNPVEWRPWGDEAFQLARREQKPIFLSVGYSTCHWCHVMAHESFEHPGIARLLNEYFVPVKVDREERPDVDHVYMAFVQATTGQGGWPMSVWLTPDLKPIYGGTYFPPADRYGRPGFPAVLQRIAELWKTERAKLIAQSNEILRGLAAATSGEGDGAEAPDAAVLEGGYQAALGRFENRHGGFGGAPKFPRPALLHFLFRYAARVGFASDQGEIALGMATFTLDKMAAGGLRDHLGGGFHRYSVDEFWHVPHFEKMLYDQAQLAASYLEAHQITGEARYAAVAREILDYVGRDLTGPEGGFYSAEDADSLLEAGKPEHAEGAFYVWTTGEIDRLLGDESELFKFHYGVVPEGNAPAGADPHGEFIGKNILIERHPASETAQRFGLSVPEAEGRLARARGLLFGQRLKRPRPHLDDKVITAWNGLMISAFAQASQILGETAYLRIAERAADFILTHLRDSTTGRLWRSYREGPSRVGAFAEDYAFLIAGLLDLHAASLDLRWLREAATLQKTMDALFWDGRSGGYFSTSGEDPSILLRTKEDYDGAEPSANSVAAENLIRLDHLLGQPQAAYREGARQLFLAVKGPLRQAPSAVPRLLASYEAFLAPPLHIAIVGEPDDEGTRRLLAEVHRHFQPHRTLLLVSPGANLDFLGEKAPFFKALTQLEGKATAYVCENFTCRLPVNQVEELRKILSAGSVARKN